MKRLLLSMGMILVLLGCSSPGEVSISSKQTSGYYAETYDEEGRNAVFTEGMPYEETVIDEDGKDNEETVVKQAPVIVERLSSEEAAKGGEITVKAKDTVYSLSREHKVPIRALITLNGLQPPYTLSIGQKLKLPASPYYTVQKGETLYSISRKFNVDVRTLASINGIDVPYIISPQQRLLLPGSIVQEEEAVKGKSAEKAIAAAAKAPGWTKAETPKKPVSKAAVEKKPVVRQVPQKTQTVVKRKTAPAGSPPSFSWPVIGKVTTNYGQAGKGKHNDGICIEAKKGTPVKASSGGTVVYAGNDLEGFGNLVLMKHEGGWVSAYAYLNEISAQKGKWIAKGTSVGTVGQPNGNAAPQLHFEIRRGTKAVNPLQYLKK